ncbi:hypothetical protein [Paenibacillus sp. JCM 10914]
MTHRTYDTQTFENMHYTSWHRLSQGDIPSAHPRGGITDACIG